MSRNFSVFDIVGPIMIGPSSSHTAGAARLAKLAASIAGEKIKKVEFQLHGSFAKTYKGHGTDKALVAGILGMDPWDDRLKNSFEIAKEKGLDISFSEIELENVHPNTVKFVITKEDNSTCSVIGSSIGGGNIIIFDIDGQEVEFKGDYPTLMTKHKDTPGVISKISTIMYKDNLNIGTMKLYRTGKGSMATMALETDNIIPQATIEKLKELPEIHSIKIINPMGEGEL
ncbi:L-serine ammonia-lyase, iron-sulfur-dependent subunit beta [Clostridium tetani]|uniref:L-serine ammonia-lyase, iron-sulfur-dependent subunit beta n=1 Tax=Clostridium tetani TaxID=1513 RepID=UPI00100B83AB|nr:L-serine ammonia-lyase, iron-sulfur-dependent subunit beta [Clostridium tetani]RXM58507.1 L-serine ammonia-lyase, iron-sulfur-dependent, subunit beta [Clostridium tetani]RXM74354.1 L-serine ammonia-lyase, iron-sulfur-dependent, subunit beta [Clostridium tetani]RYU98077.1 L-serine ammonia-lyase, iron-sulfur-dependent, subunit beta [Clostridium tetani]BDR76199.1 L-serine dehydratase, iron-sulfur-dependent subunit beta [Clostridium tetani]